MGFGYRLAAVCGLLAVLALFQQASATECVETNGAGGCFSTIQAAVDAADPGEKVSVRSGIYFENVVVPPGKDGIQIVGAGSRKKVVLDPDAPNTGPGIVIQSMDVVVRNLTIQNGQSAGISVEAGNPGVNIERVDFFGTDGICVDIASDDVSVRYNLFFACSESIAVATGVSNVEIVSNKMSNCGDNCVRVDPGSVGAVIKNNRISTSRANGISFSGDDFLIQSNFVSETGGDSFNVNCSPCTTGGVIQRNTGRFAIGDEDAFYLSADAAGLVVKNNKSDTTSDEGFDINGTGIKLEGNRARYAGGDQTQSGFHVQGADHQLIKNLAFFGVQDGFKIRGDNILLDRNRSIRNIGDGFDVESGLNTVMTRNSAFDNVGVGIEISSGVINAQLESNTAKRNRVDLCVEGSGTTGVGNKFATLGPCVIDD